MGCRDYKCSETFNGAKLQVKLKGKLKRNMSATLCFTGTEFQSVFAGSKNDKAFVRTYISELPKHLYSVFTDHRSDHVHKTRFCLIYN